MLGGRGDPPLHELANPADWPRKVNAGPATPLLSLGRSLFRFTRPLLGTFFKPRANLRYRLVTLPRYLRVSNLSRPEQGVPKGPEEIQIEQHLRIDHPSVRLARASEVPK